MKKIIHFLGSKLHSNHLNMIGCDIKFRDLSFDTVKGEKVCFSDFKDYLIFIVNTASKCGFTKQYKELEEIYKNNKNKKIVIFGFPSNDFGKQEPGTNAEVREFCDINFKITFPVSEKITVKGNDKHPIYQYLLANSKKKHEVKWNFEKFLLNGNGDVLARYSSLIKPTSKKIDYHIQEHLAQL